MHAREFVWQVLSTVNVNAQEVEAEKAKGTPYCYRYRVPKEQEVVINDAIRGDVRFSTDTLGDFVILRSNGLPVYNFCVAVDDALMKITHVIRAEEHLPNTLRQVRSIPSHARHAGRALRCGGRGGSGSSCTVCVLHCPYCRLLNAARNVSTTSVSQPNLRRGLSRCSSTKHSAGRRPRSRT